MLFLAAMCSFFIIRAGDVPYQIGYLVLVALSLFWWTEDVRKRTLRLNQTTIDWGYRKFQMSDLRSVGLTYSESEMVPKAIIFKFATGKKLEFKLGKMPLTELEAFLNRIETLAPNVVIDPVLRALVDCKRRAKVSTTVMADTDGIQLQPCTALHRLFQRYCLAVDKWADRAPILLFFICTPWWLAISSTVYMAGTASHPGALRPLILRTWLDGALLETLKFASAVWDWIESSLPKDFLTISAVLIIGLMSLGGLAALFYTALALWQPNFLSISDGVLQFQLRINRFAIALDELPITELSGLELYKAAGPEDSDRLSVSFLRTGAKKPIRLALNSIPKHERSKLLETVREKAPNCAIDPKLEELMVSEPREREYAHTRLQQLLIKVVDGTFLLWGVGGPVAGAFISAGCIATALYKTLHAYKGIIEDQVVTAFVIGIGLILSIIGGLFAGTMMLRHLENSPRFRKKATELELPKPLRAASPDDLIRQYLPTTYATLPCGASLCDGRFVVVRTLGFGGNRAKYLCRMNHNSLVVLNELRLEEGDSSGPSHPASAALEKMRDPSIVRYLDHFVENDRQYLVHEYRPGTTLRQYIQLHGPQPERVVLDHAVQIATILRRLHEQEPSIRHGNLSPDDFIVSSEGDLALTDVGDPRAETSIQSDIEGFARLVVFGLTGNYCANSQPEELLAQLDPIREQLSPDLRHLLRCAIAPAEAGTRYTSFAQMIPLLRKMSATLVFA